MSIDTISRRCYYDQAGNAVQGNWASEHYQPRLVAAFHQGDDRVTISYDLVFTRKHLSQKGRWLIHAIFLAASGAHHVDSLLTGLCAGAEEGEDRAILNAQVGAVVKAVAEILATHLISQEVWQQESKAHGHAPPLRALPKALR